MSDYSEELREFVIRSDAYAKQPIGTADALMILSAADEIASLGAQLSAYANENTNLRNDLVLLGMAKDGELDSLKTQLASARKALEWVRDQRWDENADLDTICTHAEHALTDEEGKPTGSNKQYSCPCGIGPEPCPAADGKPLCACSSALREQGETK